MMTLKHGWRAAAAAALVLAAAPTAAATPREMLSVAAFQATDKEAALAQVTAAIATAEAQIAANPRDHEARVQYAAGIGYRAKLTRNPGDAKAARRLFEDLAAANPRDPEPQLMIAGWHLDSVADLGGFLANAVLGAKAATGTAALDRAVALGRGRAFYPGFASLMRIRLDHKDIAISRQLAEMAVAAPAPTPLDRVAQRSAQAVLTPLRAGDGKAAQALAHRLLPFGRLRK